LQLLHRDDAAGKGNVAFQVRLGVRQVGPVAIDRRPVLIDRRLQRSRVYLNQQVALFDRLTRP
jgi:hypothetical protein